MLFTDLLLKITGMGRVSWDEKRTYSKGSATSVSLKNTETYLDHAIILLKKGNQSINLIYVHITIMIHFGNMFCNDINKRRVIISLNTKCILLNTKCTHILKYVEQKILTKW